MSEATALPNEPQPLPGQGCTKVDFSLAGAGYELGSLIFHFHEFFSSFARTLTHSATAPPQQKVVMYFDRTRNKTFHCFQKILVFEKIFFIFNVFHVIESSQSNLVLAWNKSLLRLEGPGPKAQASFD